MCEPESVWNFVRLEACKVETNRARYRRGLSMNGELSLMKNFACQVLRVTMYALLLAGVALSANQVAAAQQTEARAIIDKVNYDVEVHLLAATTGGERLPARLEAVARQLSASVTDTNFRVAATFLHRVKDGGNLEVKGIAGALFQAAPNTNTPTFYEFSLFRVNGSDSVTNNIIDVQNVRFGLRVPIVAGAPREGGGFPVIQYEPVGITTSISFRENTPTVVGTITTPNNNELLVIVVTVRRAAR